MERAPAIALQNVAVAVATLVASRCCGGVLGRVSASTASPRERSLCLDAVFAHLGGGLYVHINGFRRRRDRPRDECPLDSSVGLDRLRTLRLGGRGASRPLSCLVVSECPAKRIAPSPKPHIARPFQGLAQTAPDGGGDDFATWTQLRL